MNKSARKLTGLFLAAAAVYALLACLLRHAPNIVIDESLYTNLARSLLYEGRAAYRAQPAEYPFLLYPLFLVPVYALNSLLGGDVYRWVQVFNALWIASSVFPVYLLGKDCTGSEKKALTAAGLTALMPDMLMCAFEMTEALIWPLSLWGMFFAYRLTVSGKIRYGLLTGLFTGLLYAAKPGAVAMGAGFLLALLVLRLKKKSGVRDILAAVFTVLLCVILVHVLFRFVFGYSFSPLGLYTKQTSDWEASHIIAALLGFLGMAAGFIFLGGDVFVLSPYILRRNLSEQNARFLTAVTAGLAVALLGTAFLVVPFGWSGKIGDITLQMRYVAMYVPVFIVLSLAPEEKKGGVYGRSFKRAMRIFAVPALALGLKLALLPAAGSTVDALSLGAFIHNGHFDGTAAGTVCAVLLAIGALLIAFSVDPKAPRKGKQLTLTVFAAFLLFNTVCAGAAIRQPVSGEITADARQMNEWLTELDEEPLGVMQTRYSDILTYRLEAHLVRPMKQVTDQQMISSMLSTGGVYAPFVPIDQNPNTGSGPTPETRTLVLGETVLTAFEPAPETEVRLTDNGIYALITVPEGERWLTSMLYGLDDGILDAGKEASLICFEPQPAGTLLAFHANAPKNGTKITFTAGGQTQEYTLSGEGTLEVPVTGTQVKIQADGDLIVSGYSTFEL